MRNVKTLCRSLVISSALLAISLPNALGDVPQCNTFSTLGDYLVAGNTGCRLGDKTLSDFAFLFSGGTSSEGYQAPLVPAASEVTVVTGAADNSATPAWVSLTFNFNGNASVAANQTMYLQIQYVVKTAPLIPHTNAYITGIDTTGVGGRRTQSSQSSVAKLESDVCLGGPFDVSGAAATGSCPDPYAELSTWSPSQKSYGTPAASNPNLVANQKTIYGSIGGLSATRMGVYTYIDLMGGSADSPAAAPQAAASTVTDTFYESYSQIPVPEPVPFLLVGSALIGLGVWCRQKTA